MQYLLWASVHGLYRLRLTSDNNLIPSSEMPHLTLYARYSSSMLMQVEHYTAKLKTKLSQHTDASA